MRRLSACLMVAVLLAALVPSSALAGKPVPSVTSVQITGYGASGPGCGVQMWAGYSGRPYAVRFSWWEVGAATYTGYVDSYPSRKSTATGISWIFTDLGTKEWYWKVAILDRKGKVVGTEVTTTQEVWNDPSSCPTLDYGYLGKYPSWL